MELGDILNQLPNSVAIAFPRAYKKRKSGRRGANDFDELDEANRLFRKGLRYDLCRGAVGYCDNCELWYQLDDIAQLHCPEHGEMLSDRHYKKPRYKVSYTPRREGDTPASRSRHQEPDIAESKVTFDEVKCDKVGGKTKRCLWCQTNRCVITAKGRTTKCPRGENKDKARKQYLVKVLDI